MRFAYVLSILPAIVVATTDRVTEAQQVRQFEKDGVLYQETRTTERKPVTSVQWQEQQQTVYRQQPTTDVYQYQRTVYWPVVRYRCEPRWHGLLNPFSPPYVTYHMRPTVEWQARNETVETPVTYQRWVPQTRIVKTPVRSLGFVEQESVSVARLTSPAPAIASPPPTNRAVIAEHYGPMVVTGRPAPVPPTVGLGRMQGDPPRQGTTVLR